MLRKMCLKFGTQISICPLSRQSVCIFKAGGNPHQCNVKKCVSVQIWTEKQGILKLLTYSYLLLRIGWNLKKKMEI